MIKALPRIYSFVSVTWKIIGKKRDNMDSSMFRKTGAANSKSFLFLHPPMAHPSCIGISGDSAKPSAFPMTWGDEVYCGSAFQQNSDYFGNHYNYNCTNSVFKEPRIGKCYKLSAGRKKDGNMNRNLNFQYFYIKIMI
ncbi:hypothetical protein [Frisingicoccus sp.]|jgi:hypothetical protein|uniref:hypothetical protein n=1 Tax=Frisingicoccus sp. TaxID=1918627 RepID=UPI003AB4F4F9